MFPRDTLVAEDAADFEHAIESADEQPFQPQLGRDAQVKIRAERVVVGDERPRRRAARRAFKHRRLGFDELARLKKAADMRDDPRPQLQTRARLRVDDQIEVALPVDLLRIGETVEFFRERA